MFMPNRRAFLAGSVAATTAAIGPPQVFSAEAKTARWHMPDESAQHTRTWMAFGPRADIWGERLLPEVRRNLATIATTIAKYEPVTMLVRREERDLAARLCGDKVRLVDAPLDDLWIRDSGPTFVLNDEGELGGVDLNFNGWGEKQDYDRDAEVAGLVAELADCRYIGSEVTGEGGGIEVDGHGTAIVTESCFLNRNRNPGMTKADIEAEFARVFGIKKVIWLPGVRGEDITDGHTDFYARFARPGVVLAHLEWDRNYGDYELTRDHLKRLQAARDARSKPLEVIALPSPRRVRSKWETEEFTAGYINYYVANGVVVAPQFGDAKADGHCRDVLTKLFPRRDVIQLNIDAIAAGGGGIHCATQQQPKAGVGQGLP